MMWRIVYLLYFLSFDLEGNPQGDPCTVLNANDGRLYLSFPATGYCCNCSAAFTVRSDWLQDGGTTYVGQTLVGNINTNEWLKQGASDNHYYSSLGASEQPVRYMEHKNGKLKQWDFQEWTKKQPGGAWTSIFDPPNGCSSVCESTVCKFI